MPQPSRLLAQAQPAYGPPTRRRQQPLLKWTWTILTATSVLGSLLANKNCVGFLSANHTSDMVEVTAWGPGCGAIRPVIQNTDLHAVVVDALELAPARAL